MTEDRVSNGSRISGDPLLESLGESRQSAANPYESPASGAPEAAGLAGGETRSGLDQGSSVYSPLSDGKRATEMNRNHETARSACFRRLVRIRQPEDQIRE